MSKFLSNDLHLAHTHWHQMRVATFFSRNYKFHFWMLSQCCGRDIWFACSAVQRCETVVQPMHESFYFFFHVKSKMHNIHIHHQMGTILANQFDCLVQFITFSDVEIPKNKRTIEMCLGDKCITFQSIFIWLAQIPFKMDFDWSYHIYLSLWFFMFVSICFCPKVRIVE